MRVVAASESLPAASASCPGAQEVLASLAEAAALMGQNAGIIEEAAEPRVPLFQQRHIEGVERELPLLYIAVVCIVLLLHA